MLTVAVEKKLAGPFEVLDVAGLRVLYLFKDALVHVAALGPGCPMQRTIMPMPPRGRVVAGSALEVSVVCDDATLWHWNYVAEVWSRVGNPREGT